MRMWVAQDQTMNDGINLFFTEMPELRDGWYRHWKGQCFAAKADFAKPGTCVEVAVVPVALMEGMIAWINGAMSDVGEFSIMADGGKTLISQAREVMR